MYIISIMTIDNDLQGSSETAQYQLKSYFIQYVLLCIVCIIIIGLIVRTQYLDESERTNTSELIILVVSSLLVAYRLYNYFM
jgi:hypothetical protein